MADHARAQKRALIAEDTPSWQKRLAVETQAVGFEATVAANRSEAATKVRTGHFDVLVLDPGLPSMLDGQLPQNDEGVRLLQEIRAMGKALPVLAVSATGDVVVVSELFMEHGIAGFFSKADWERESARFRKVLGQMVFDGATRERGRQSLSLGWQDGCRSHSPPCGQCT